MAEKRSEYELILYTSEDGDTRLHLRAGHGSVWLTRDEMAELFAIPPAQVSAQLARLRADGELDASSVRQPAASEPDEGLVLYDLDAILLVGYSVRSRRGAQFRLWVTSVLREYLAKGFALDESRLGLPEWDYYDELLERIKEIRGSEVRFYGKVRDLLALSEDYVPNDPEVSEFYRRVQNRMLYAVTKHTAAELIIERADPKEPNMGATSWRGGRVRKADANVAKNYLTKDELALLNRIVTMFLDAAELRASRRESMRLADWEELLESFLKSNDLPLLEGEGGVTPEYAKRVAHERYALFDERRRAAEKLADGEVSELEELKRIAEAAGRPLPKSP